MNSNVWKTAVTLSRPPYVNQMGEPSKRMIINFVVFHDIFSNNVGNVEPGTPFISMDYL